MPVPQTVRKDSIDAREPSICFAPQVVCRTEIVHSVHQITPRISAAGVVRDGDVLICLLRVQHASAVWNTHWERRTSINVVAVIL